MDAPIGVFDSGVGGLTVMRQLIHALPNESVIYLGDTARLPYGEKSRDTIIRFSRENAAFLCTHGVKILVVACHTASAMALDSLKQELEIPVIGVVTAGVDEALASTRSGRIGILGTRGTVGTGAHAREIKRQCLQAEVFSVACPLFVSLVEERLMDHPATLLIAQDYLEQLSEHNVDTIILACTHYPLLRHVIQTVMGDHITLVDPAEACAKEVKSLLETHRIRANRAVPNAYRFFVSDDPGKFQNLGCTILGREIESIDTF